MNKNNKPAIRFKGFTEPWEQRKLENLISVGNGMDYKNLGEGTIPVYGTGGYMLSVDKALSHDKDAIGIGRKGTIDRPYILQAPFWTVDTLFYCIPREKYTLDFVYCIFQNIDWKKKDESTGVPSLSKININSIEVKTTCFNEQQKIGTFFSQVDNLITLHQRKYDKLQIMKKACLEKMFPKQGSNVPEIRFKGFTEPWKKYEFGEIYEKVSQKNDLTYGKEDIISVANMYYKKDSNITDNNYLLTYNVFKLGDIAFEGNKSKNFSHGRFVENTIGNGIVSHVFDVFKPIMAEFDLMFWKYAINNERLMGSILMRSTKASTMMTNLVATDFLKEKFYVPSYEEQKSIGSFFKRLDDLVSYQEQELEKLQNIKKSCLEKMFV